MSIALATLQRHSATVWLHDSLMPPASVPPKTPFAFGRAEEAGDYLDFWKNDAAALAALRYALYRCEQSSLVYALADAQVLQALAAKLAQGALLLTDSEVAGPAGGWPVVASAPLAAPASGTLINLNTLPDRPPVPPLLPLLEELQIEGAEVLPEIEQTLEQIDLTMASIDLAGVSLQPTPSKVPLIEVAMTDASAVVTKTLDDL